MPRAKVAGQLDGGMKMESSQGTYKSKREKGAWATGIEPEMASQEDLNVIKRPQRDKKDPTLGTHFYFNSIKRQSNFNIGQSAISFHA
jgi:hypothetical protein